MTRARGLPKFSWEHAEISGHSGSVQGLRPFLRKNSSTNYFFGLSGASLRLSWDPSALSWGNSAPIAQTLSAKGQI